jgi:hypothetical protein
MQAMLPPRFPPALVLAILAVLSPSVRADAPRSISVETGRSRDGTFTLAGRDASQQLLVSGQYAEGPARDLTNQVKYESDPPDVVGIDATGLVSPRKEGRAVIKVEGPGGVRASATVLVTHLVEDLPVHFQNEVVPIFTKLGCNAGGCHGKAGGQNGFKLSLLGFEPGEDYEYLVKEARGRRVQPSAPEQSLLLLKATGAVGHGGGKRLDRQSPYYSVLRRWIEQGARNGGPDEPVVERIEILPRERVLERGGWQQLVVVARYSDGSARDVTRMAQFEANQPELAEVSATGLVTVKRLPGVVAMMARFQSHVDAFRASIPLGATVAELPPAQNFIDELVFMQLKKLGLPPSPVCNDATFLRRVTIDIAGRLPTQVEVEQFLADKDADKHRRLVDRLLDSGDYADYFANKWGAILRNRRSSATDDPKPTAAFHDWIRDCLHQNLPYDQFARAILTASGEEVKNPPVVWYREVKDPSAQTEDVAQLFLGQRIGCARCHHHPLEKWGQQDYFGLAAFFSRLDVKDPPAPKPKKGAPPEAKLPLLVSHKPGDPEMMNPRTGQPVPPTALGGKSIEIATGADPREKLADWMADKDNPFFARALVNRYWKHFFGRGLVEPEDDLRATNPPTNPELLDALAKHFVERKYDLKALIRTLCTSQTYRLSAVPNAHNADDRQNFSRFLPRRLAAEVLLDAIDEVTQAKTAFKGVAKGTRAVQLPDNLVDSYFLSVFGRPDAASACECERSSDGTLAQCLHMFNSLELLGKVGSGRAKQLAADKRPHAERLRDLYLVALSREPTKEEIAVLVAYIEGKEDVQATYEDVVWTVINTKEFLFNH